MAKKKDQTEEQLANVEEALSKTEQFIENNQKILTYTVLGIVGLVLLIMAYNKYIKQPNEMEAFNTIWKAEQYFGQDSFRLALEGDGVYPGFLDIIDDYGSTKSGNLANYYAGICYLRLAKADTTLPAEEYYQNAIDYLKDFSSDDAAVKPMALGAIGDAYDQLGESSTAAEYYEKAANYNDNDFTTPLFLMKAGIMYSQLDDHNKALELFNKIKEDYYTSNQGREIKKYIAREEALLGQ